MLEHVSHVHPTVRQDIVLENVEINAQPATATERWCCARPPLGMELQTMANASHAQTTVYLANVWANMLGNA